MAYLEPKLVAKLAQKQVLTPGLVQMVSLLTLNKLELTEMIQQELVQNPVLEEGTEIVESTEPVPEIEMEAGQEAPGPDAGGCAGLGGRHRGRSHQPSGARPHRDRMTGTDLRMRSP